MKPFILEQDLVLMTHASQTGYGYCILQFYKTAKQLNAILYGFQALTKARSKHTTVELELKYPYRL